MVEAQGARLQMKGRARLAAKGAGLLWREERERKRWRRLCQKENKTKKFADAH